MTTPPVKIIECPRDAWQAMPQQIPPEVKADYLRALAAAGFTAYRRCLFCVPIGGAANGRFGAGSCFARSRTQRWRSSPSWSISRARSGQFAPAAVRTLGFPYSISATFLERNQRQTPEQARQTLAKIISPGFAGWAGRGGLSVHGLRQSLRRPLAAGGRD